MSPRGVSVEPSLIEYARFHGLAINHLNQDISSFLKFGLPLNGEEAHLADFKLPDILDHPKEPKFRLDRSATTFLASCLNPPPAPCLQYELLDHQSYKRLKLEPPVLKIDHGTNMRRLGRRRPAKKEMLNLPPIPVNEDAGEGLGWPNETTGLSATWDKSLAHEKLQVPREALKVMQDTLRPVYTMQMHEAIVAEDLSRRKVQSSNGLDFIKSDRKWRLQPDPLSPPLMPSDFDDGYYVPSSPALRLPLLSDAPDPDQELILKLNDRMSSQNCISPEDGIAENADQVQDLLRFAQNGPPFQESNLPELREGILPETNSLLARFPSEISEVEPLLSPVLASKAGDGLATPIAPSEGFAPELTEETDSSRAHRDSHSRDELLSHFTCEEMQAADGNFRAGRLEPDDTMRVEVPALDDVKFAEPWAKLQTGEFVQTMLTGQLRIRQRDVDGTLEGKLNWTPISGAFLELAVKEAIETPTQSNEWVSEPELDVKSEDLLWHPELLGILCPGEESEEELEVDETLQDELVQDEPVQQSQKPRQRPALSDLTESFLKRQPRPLSLPESGFGASGLGSLAGFMDTRKAYKKPFLSPNPHERAGTNWTEKTPTIDSLPKTTNHVQVPVTPVESPGLDVAALSSPAAPVLSSPLTVFLNSGVLKSHRQLTQALEYRLQPFLTIIYRDLDDNSSNQTAAPDIIISPTTAAIITSLQATTQRSLPGQGGPSRSPISRRIANLSLMFENVFVLVTLSPTDTCSFTSPATSSQLSSLTSFCASLSRKGRHIVRLIFVPSGPIATTPLPHTAESLFSSFHEKSQRDFPLFNYTHFLITKHGSDPISYSSVTAEARPLTFLHEETVWELFLRKAGLNPYAAQFVLAMLKKPDVAQHQQQQQQQQGDQDGQQESDAPLWGLSAFVQMTRDERIRRFSPILGLDAVERVSKVLDARWT